MWLTIRWSIYQYGILECILAMSLLDEFSPTLHKNLSSRRSHSSLKIRISEYLLGQNLLSSSEKLWALKIVACVHSSNISWILTNFMLKFNTKNIAVSYIWKRVMPEYIGESNPWFIYENYITLLKLILLLLLFPILILLFLKVCLLVVGGVKISSPLFNRKRSMSRPT